MAARFDVTNRNKQIGDFIDTYDSVEKRSAFAKRMRKLKGAEAMATSLAAIAKGKEIALVPEGQEQLPQTPKNTKVNTIQANHTNWNNYEILSNYVNDEDGKQIKDTPIDKLDPDKTYNRCIFVVTETTAEEMLEGRIRIPEERAAVALLVPQANYQEHWKSFRPVQHQVLLQNRETKNLVTTQAWLLQLGSNDVQSTNEDAPVVSFVGIQFVNGCVFNLFAVFIIDIIG